jgi:D-amino-acid dehydrogenase
MRTRRGAEVQVLDAPEIRQIEPALSERYRRAVLLPEHGYAADPRALVTRIAAWFSDNGGNFVKGAVTSVGSKGRPHVVLSSGETIEADDIVLAAGAWSGELLARAGIRVPLETQRGYHVTLEKPNIELRRPITLADDKIYVTPMLGGLRAAGTVEFAGLTARPNWERARRLIGIARKALPHLSYGGASEWMGHRPCLPDSLPAIGPIAKLPGVYAAFGHGHNGMTSGPVTGRIVADLVAARVPPIDIAPYRFERLH